MSTRNVEEELAQGIRFGYRPEFDGLRGVAILGVVLLHYFPERFRAAIIGVDLFFVLSGFLLTRLMLEERQRYGTVSLRNFYVKRIARLGPGMLLLVIPTVLGALLFLREQRTELLWGSLASITFTNNWFRVAGVDIGGLGHLWSIASEEQFYLLWPLLVLATGLRVRRLRSLAAAIVLAAAVNIVVRSLYGEQYDVLALGLDARAGLLLVTGGWLATVLPTQGIRGFNSRVLTLALAVALALRTYFCVGLAADDYQVAWKYGGIQLSALVMVLVIIATMELNWAKRLLAARQLCWLGKRAYGIFLWHQPVEMLVEPYFSPTVWLRKPLFFVLTLVLAYLSYRFVEQPCRAYIIRRYGDPARRPSKVAALS